MPENPKISKIQLPDGTIYDIKDVDLEGYVPTSRTVNGKALNTDITLNLTFTMDTTDTKKLVITYS